MGVVAGVRGWTRGASQAALMPGSLKQPWRFLDRKEFYKGCRVAGMLQNKWTRMPVWLCQRCPV